MALTVAGGVIALAGAAIAGDLGGAAAWLVRNLTSRDLGSLAPGYAADPVGIRVYGVLIAGLGAALAGAGLAGPLPLAGLALLAAGILVFAVCSVVIIAGEVRTYRALPGDRRRP